MLLTLALGKTAPAVTSHLDKPNTLAVKPAAKVKAELTSVKKVNKSQDSKSQSKPAPRPRKVVRAPIGCANYKNLVALYDWSVNVALAVMKAESGCNPMALSPTADRGLMQVNAVHAAKVGGDLSRLYDPATNIRVAYQVYLGAGWRAWSVCNRGIVSCY